MPGALHICVRDVWTTLSVLSTLIAKTYRDHECEWSAVDEQAKAGDHDNRENAAHHIVAPSASTFIG